MRVARPCRVEAGVGHSRFSGAGRYNESRITLRLGSKTGSMKQRKNRVMARRFVGIAVAVLTLATSIAHAEVSLPAIFGDHMVLQSGRDLPFWGTAEPGEEITVSISRAEPANGAKAEMASTTAGADGRWSVKLPARTAGETVAVTVAGKNSVTFANVLIGEVWICSGQSNMEWPVSAANNHVEEIAQAKYPSIRIFKVERSTALVPQSRLDGHWVECSPDTVGDTSAVGYYFGRELHRDLKRPVGLIVAAVGGAYCESWTSLAALKSDEEFAPILQRADRANGDPNQANNPNRASVLFNGMIAPLLPFPIAGTIWYQGESNVQRAFQYRKLFPLLITDWRRHWGQAELPFLFVQLANYVPDKSKPDHPAEPEDSAWAELREAQALALQRPKTGMAVTIDIGDPHDINPKNKQEVGRRLARLAARVAYGHEIVSCGPLFKSMKINRTEATLEFENVGDGLACHGGKLIGFAIAGSDRKFVWASARIEGKTVVVSSPKITEPVAVRYAWGDNPEGNLFNELNLPAAPFRTDDWPGVTVQNK